MDKLSDICNSSVISVIVPVYNVEKYVERCLNSLINQTYKALEIIIINDGSTDKSGEICDLFARKDDRIKILHKENGGVSSARNSGLEIASGEWIGFVDADDWVDLTMYEKLVRAAQENDKKQAICNIVRYYSKTKQENFVKINLPRVISREQSLLYSLDVKNRFFHCVHFNRIFHFSRLINKDGSVVRFDSAKHWGEDTLFTIQLTAKTDGVAYVDEPLYFYFQREGSAVYTINEKRMTGLLSLNELIEIVKPISQRVEMEASLKYARGILMLVSQLCHTKQYGEVKPLRKEFMKYFYISFFKKGFTLKMKIENLVALTFPKSLVGFISRHKRKYVNYRKA